MVTREQIEAARKVAQMSDEWLGVIIDVAEKVRRQDPILRIKLHKLLFSNDRVNDLEREHQTRHVEAVIDLVMNFTPHE